jgi:glutamine amidotransferase
MNANVPTDICFSFAGLMRRGGERGPHRDGWGIAFYDGKGCRAFHDPQPSARSEIARFIRGYAIKSRIVICHIRRAGRSRVALENTHPFARELWGRNWDFAHNGELNAIKKPPSSRALISRLGELSRTVAGHGTFNMLLSDGRYLYCFGDTALVWLTRRAPFGPATLIDEDLTVDFSKETTPNDVVTVVATRPLTRDECWTTVAKRSLIAFRDGTMIG